MESALESRRHFSNTAMANSSTVAKPGSRLRELGLVLPQPPSPLGAYVEASQVGSLLFISGTLPLVDRKLAISGRLGANLSVDQGREAARLAALNALAAAQEYVGDLVRLRKLVKLSVLLFDDGGICRARSRRRRRLEPLCPTFRRPGGTRPRRVRCAQRAHRHTGHG